MINEIMSSKLPYVAEFYKLQHVDLQKLQHVTEFQKLYDVAEFVKKGDTLLIPRKCNMLLNSTVYTATCC